jgi:hypothetical protein
MGRDILDTLGARQVGQKIYGFVKEASDAFNDTVLGLLVAGSNKFAGTDIKLEDVPFASQSAIGTKQAIQEGSSPLWAVTNRETKAAIDLGSVGIVPLVEQEAAAINAYNRGKLTDAQFQDRLNDITYSAEANALIAIGATSPQIDSALGYVGNKVYNWAGPKDFQAPVTTGNAPELPPGWDYGWDLRDPSRPSSSNPSWYDMESGEWRYQPEDQYHNAHWDYNAHERLHSPWWNVPGWKGLPPRKANCPTPGQNINPKFNYLLDPEFKDLLNPNQVIKYRDLLR